jgi:hypothetical protein
MLTYVPPLNSLRLRRAATGGTSSARYCYGVWLRHLIVLAGQGFQLKNAAVGELGPGDSIGTGLAALLAGADRYVGLDVVPYAATADMDRVLRELVQLYSSRASIPDHNEFPGVRPRLPSYDFPDHLVDLHDLPAKVDRIKSDLAGGLGSGQHVSYRAPWFGVDDVEPASLDLLFSQGVLQCVDDLAATYRTMFAWLKPGGYSSHSTGFGANNFSPYWNGHWAYSELEWRVVRGRREWLPNRHPLSVHLQSAREAGFEVLRLDVQSDTSGLAPDTLAKPYRQLGSEDLSARGAMMILQKPATSR